MKLARRQNEREESPFRAYTYIWCESGGAPDELPNDSIQERDVCARIYIIYFGVSLSFLRKLTAADDTLLLLALRGVCVVTKIWNSCDYCCFSFTHCTREHSLSLESRDVHHNIVCLFIWIGLEFLKLQSITVAKCIFKHLGGKFALFTYPFNIKQKTNSANITEFLMVQYFDIIIYSSIASFNNKGVFLFFLHFIFYVDKIF